MMGDYEGIFVGSVAGALGLFLIVAAATNWSWYYALRSARFFESKFGRTGTRLFHAALGVALIALGFCIATGVRWMGGAS